MLRIKNMGKKIVAISLVVALFATTGCGGKSKGDSASTSSTGSSTESSDTTSKDMVTISLYRSTYNIASPNDAEAQKVQDAINAYIGDKIGVKIELHDIGSSEYTDKANLALAGGEADLLFSANWMQSIGTDDLVSQNAVCDLTKMLPKYDLYSSVPDWVWSTSAYNGKNYFIPCYKEAAEGYDMMFRKDLVDKYGWDLSKVHALKDVEPMLADCLKEGLKYPYLIGKTAMFDRLYLDKYDFFTGDSFIAVDKDKDAVVDTITSADYKDFTTLMGDWADKGYISEDEVSKTVPDTEGQTQNWGFSFWTDVPNNDESNARYKQDVDLVKMTQNWVMSNSTLGSCYAISANASPEKVDAALKFLSLLYTDKTLADLYTYGIEGTDYTRDEDGSVTKSDAGLYDHSPWESTSITALSLVTGEPANKIDLYTTFNDNAKKSIAAGFRFDSSSVSAEYAACVQVFNEFGYVLECGGYSAADVDSAIADYQKALDDAGYQTILAEAQKQYDAWKALR